MSGIEDVKKRLAGTIGYAGATVVERFVDQMFKAGYDSEGMYQAIKGKDYRELEKIFAGMLHLATFHGVAVGIERMNEIMAMKEQSSRTDEIFDNLGVVH